MLGLGSSDASILRGFSWKSPAEAATPNRRLANVGPSTDEK